MKLDDIKSDFDVLDDWEDRYRHVIELGRNLPPFEDNDRTAANKVSGCASQVWLVTKVSGAPDNPILHFSGDSDALIVKGLVAIALMIFSGRPAREIMATDAESVLRTLGLKEHLTPQRSNGFISLIGRIKAEARAALQVPSFSGNDGR